MARFVPLSLFACLTLGCAPANDSGETGSTVECVSGAYWTGGNEESAKMNPGESCIGCHDQDEGPRYAAAGTVMGGYTEPDDCNGAEGVTVRLTDADGIVHETETNSAGNFYFKDAIAMPYTAEIESADGMRPMSAEQADGDCASCHTVSGEEGAPGRIVAP